MVIRARRGSTLSVTRQFVREGEPVDLTGATVWFTAKWRNSDADVDAKVAKSTAAGGVTVLDAATGFFEVTFSAAETAELASGDYVYDLKVAEPSGEITVIEDGALVVGGGVTEASA